jgi:hypothetical protein
VGGNTEVVTQQANSTSWDITDTSIGLQVIAAEHGTLIDKISTEASSVRPSPDGKQIFLTGRRNGITWTEVYDISSHNVIKHLDNMYLMPTRRWDGEVTLVADQYYGNNGDKVCYTALIDPAAWTITNRWKGYCIAWLISP